MSGMTFLWWAVKRIKRSMSSRCCEDLYYSVLHVHECMGGHACVHVCMCVCVCACVCVCVPVLGRVPTTIVSSS